MKHQSQRGVALVVTLLMLSVITFLTVAFLIASRRDRASVDLSLTQTDARLASDVALARAQGEILARMRSRNELLSYDLQVSRSYSNPNGFNSRIEGYDPANVSYEYPLGDGPVAGDDLIRNIGNLYYDPQVPVYVRTNSDVRLPLDFRHYLDINRNGRFEPSGFFGVTADSQLVRLGDPRAVATNYFTGDPQWVGILRHPEYPHSPTNQFIARFAFLAQPAGKTLDVNFNHNYAKGNTGLGPDMRFDGFLRHQGHGAWEIDLAAFFETWNPVMYRTNQYHYEVSPGLPNSGAAFADALSILRYRHGHNFENVWSKQRTFSGNANYFGQDGIDGYTTSPLLAPPYQYAQNNSDPDSARLATPWPGGYGMNYFQDPQDLFDPRKTSPGFVARMTNTFGGTNIHDRYAFSRLLSALGTHSDPELRGKVHLNFRNDPKLNTVPAEPVAWTPLGFFTNAADVMLKGHVRTNAGSRLLFGMAVGADFSLTNIQVFPTNQYTAPVHRLLQVAANIYDSTTNRVAPAGQRIDFPSVFRPHYRYDSAADAVYIAGYTEVTNLSQVFGATPWVDLNERAERERIALFPNAMPHGATLVIGVKKGLPNFNEYSLLSAVTITRKLQLRRPNVNSLPNQTNEMYLVSITNAFGVEAWNSYTQRLERPVAIYMTNQASIHLTNRHGLNQRTNVGPQGLVALQPFWPGAPLNLTPNAAGPQMNFWARQSGVQTLPLSTYRLNGFEHSNAGYQAGFTSFELAMTMTNRLTFAITDPATGRILDFVSLNDIRTVLDLNELLSENNVLSRHDLWNTNRPSASSPPQGVLNQLAVSQGRVPVSETVWTDYNANVNDKGQAQASFAAFLRGSPSAPLVTDAPFQPSIAFIHRRNLQANDPLVHYTVEDLTGPRQAQTEPVAIGELSLRITNSAHYNIGKVNNRFAPWDFREAVDGMRTNVLFKDPQIRRPDNWQFLTNKFANIGWLGMVHRGTPWQTIYLKSEAEAGLDATQLQALRQKWTSEWVSTGMHTYPVADWELLDYFTVAPHDNAARGLLSVNQADEAAWAAVLAGTLVTTNPASGVFPLAPDTVSGGTAIGQIWSGITRERNARSNQVFTAIGQLLAAPEMTLSSPFIQQAQGAHLTWTDADYERLPQQIASLLRLGEPRYVIYAFGQSLKPADRSFALSPPRPDLQNIVTNYQVTGESVSRAIVRFERDSEGTPRPIIESYSIVPPPE